MNMTKRDFTKGLVLAAASSGLPRRREEPLSRFLGKPAPKAAPAAEFVKPLSPDEEKTSPEFFNILNCILQYCPTDPSEIELRKRFATIGVEAGKAFDANKLSPEVRTAVEQGMADAWIDFATLQKEEIDTGKLIGRRWAGLLQLLTKLARADTSQIHACGSIAL
jgi:hypothetical protein